MLFPCVTPHNRGAMISTRFIGAEHLLWQALLQIDHEILVKFKVTHNFTLCGVYFLTEHQPLLPANSSDIFDVNVLRVIIK